MVTFKHNTTSYSLTIETENYKGNGNLTESDTSTNINFNLEDKFDGSFKGGMSYNNYTHSDNPSLSYTGDRRLIGDFNEVLDEILEEILKGHEVEQGN